MTDPLATPESIHDRLARGAISGYPCHGCSGPVFRDALGRRRCLQPVAIGCIGRGA